MTRLDGLGTFATTMYIYPSAACHGGLNQCPASDTMKKKRSKPDSDAEEAVDYYKGVWLGVSTPPQFPKLRGLFLFVSLAVYLEDLCVIDYKMYYVCLSCVGASIFAQEPVLTGVCCPCFFFVCVDSQRMCFFLFI